MNKLKLKKGDKVIILAGKDKGKTGVIEKVFVKSRSVLIPKLNLVKKHVKVTKENPAGGVIDAERPIPISKVELICPNCSKRARVGYKITGKEKKRICKRCHKVIEIQKDKEK